MHIEPDLNAAVIFHIMRLAETLKRNGNRLTEAFGITTQQWVIMLMLANDPNVVGTAERGSAQPLLAKEIADTMQVSRANITNLLAPLLEQGLVQQIEDEKDKRRKRLKLTKAGEKVLKKLEPIRKVSNQKLMDTFSMEQKEQIVQFVHVCLETMKKTKH